MDLNIGKLFSRLDKQGNKDGIYNTSPTPGDILRAELPVRKLVGLRVRWDLTLVNMMNDINPDELLVVASSGATGASIWIPLDLKRYPQVLRLSSRSPISVQGQIKNVQGKNIYLENCALAGRV